MSQDHLEFIFEAIINHCGSSNNPNLKQFQIIYKRLLFKEVYKELL